MNWPPVRATTMQRTRLTAITERITQYLNQWLMNPWRRLSISVISLLLGYFFALSLAAIAGQAARQDIFISALLAIATELISRLVYRWQGNNNPGQPRPLLYDSLNLFKIGGMYALYVEAFKLGS